MPMPMPMPIPTNLQQMLLACVRTLKLQPVANTNVFDLSTMLSVVLLVLSSHVALSAAAAALTLQSEAARVDLFAGWSRDELDCFGTTCPSERVYNIFLDAPPPSAAGQSFCEWSDAFVAAGATDVWSEVAGENVELRVESLVAALFGDECRDGALLTAAGELVRINGAAPINAVQVNVIELGDTDPISAATFGEQLCYRSPSACAEAAAQGERVVVNVFVAEWCASGCLQTRESAPTCDKWGCDAAHGQCVADNVCVCAPGYAGVRCATRAGCESHGCSGRGVCDPLSGVCACSAGFEGAACEQTAAAPSATTAPSATPDATATADDGVQPGTPIAVDETWLAPYSIFPRGNFTHFGALSFGQLPLRENWQQNARSPAIEQPLAASAPTAAQGFVAARADYERAQLYFEIAFSVPRGAIEAGGASPTAELFGGKLGQTGERLAALNTGFWCEMPSWVSLDWEAWKLNGTVPLDAAADVAELLQASEAYVELRTAAQPDGVLRAQLVQFDAALVAPLSGDAADAQGAGLFLLDERSNTLQFWVYYTAPLDYIERGATLNTAAADNEVHPLPLGTTGLRRVGDYDRTLQQPFTVVCALSKFGVWRFDDSVYGADVAARIRAGDFTVHISSFDAVNALGGVIAP